MQNTKLIGIGIGFCIIIGSFLAVFGSSLDNLVVDTDDTINQSAIENTTGTNSVTNKTSTKKPATVSGDSDDDVYDDDDIGTVPAKTTTTSTSTTTTTTTPKPTTGGYTLTQIATHNSASSCWSAINGSVYDLTSWVNAHPGGKAAILMICGKDGSPLFNTQHGSSGKIANILANYKIGTLN